ncbi:MAG: hypothetical protein RDV48_02530 [Candidatus Eremiobacteraeota bacterium]|nr:hypothetical protein [Candidatus Eremiobacteraeota bacterium]
MRIEFAWGSLLPSSWQISLLSSRERNIKNRSTEDAPALWHGVGENIDPQVLGISSLSIFLIFLITEHTPEIKAPAAAPARGPEMSNPAAISHHGVS